MFFLKTKERKVKRQWWFPNEKIIFISCHNAVLGRVSPNGNMMLSYKMFTAV